MKRLYVFGIVTLIIHGSAAAQLNTSDTTPVTINSIEISICYNKTTSLIFPYAVISVDRGSADVLAQKAKAVENILHVKAGKRNFTPTNLSVVTADGKFYSFLLHYEENPMILSVPVDSHNMAQLPSKIINEKILDMEAYAVKVQPGKRLKSVSQAGLEMTLNGIFFSDQNVWFSLLIDNNSAIDFKPDYIRFFLRGRKEAKRTAIQETILTPNYSDVPNNITFNSTNEMIVALSSFFIPKEKYLVVQIGERNSGRMLTMRIKQKKLLCGVRLPR